MMRGGDKFSEPVPTLAHSRRLGSLLSGNVVGTQANAQSGAERPDGLGTHLYVRPNSSLSLL